MSELVHNSYNKRVYALDEYDVREEWNNAEALKVFWLTRKHKVCVDGLPPFSEWRKVASSKDPEWAKRQREHYRLNGI